MKHLKVNFLVIFLLILFIYITNINSIPSNIVLFKGEELELNTLFGIYINENLETIEAGVNLNNKNILEKKNVSLKLFNLFDVKKIEVNTIPKTTVIPLGNSVGLKLYTTGVLVVGMTEVQGEKPYKNAGIEEGDMIIKINEEDVTCTQELVKKVNSSNGNNISIKYVRDGKEYLTTMKPIKTPKNDYKLGLWVRDGAAGIGTITYYEPSTKKYAALGHGILDIDTSKLINIASGELVTARISSIVKGKNGAPRRNKRKYYKPEKQ